MFPIIKYFIFILQALKNRTKKIFVGGVPTDMPEETIKEYFVQFGEVRAVFIFLLPYNMCTSDL